MSTAVFPPLSGLEYPVIRTPMAGKTLVQTSVSGKENRVQLWSYPRYRWTLSFNFLRDDSNNEFRTLCAFLLARGGSYDSFLFNDVDDNTVTGQGIGTGNGTATQFQLVRSFGGYTEPVLAPHTVTTVYYNGTPFSGSVWSVNSSGGILTFTSPPAGGLVLTADFTYYWPVRFMTDEYDFSKVMNKIWEQKKIELISLKNWP